MQDNQNRLVFQVPVLLYHSISNNPHDRIAVHPKLFFRHMDMLKSEFNVLSLPELNRLFKNNLCFGDNTVVVTFDDGYEDAYTNALPVLNKLNIPATFFISPAYLGMNNDWNTRAYTRLKHLDTKQLSSIFNAGHTIGSHGLTHAYLPKLEDIEIEYELSKSKEMLENVLNTIISFISYPYGDPDQRVIEMSKKHYELGFRTNHTSFSDWTQGPFEIARIPIYNDISIESLKQTLYQSINKDSSDQYVSSKINLGQFLDKVFKSDSLSRMGHGQDLKSKSLGIGWLYYSFVRACRIKKCVVIGSWRGFVPMVLAHAICQDSTCGEVIFIDPGLVDEFWHDPIKVKEYFLNFGLENIRHFRATTQEFTKTEEFKNLDNIGILFIDGMHTYDQSKLDFEVFEKKLTPGGFIFLHDSMDTNTTKIYGLDKIYKRSTKLFVDELKNQGNYESIDFYGDKGLTIFQVPKNGNVNKS